MSNTSTVVLITGGNKGVGFATVQALLCSAKSNNYTIYLGSRSLERANAAIEKLKSDHSTGKSLESGVNIVKPVQIDIDDEQSVSECRKLIGESVGKVDVLINNAGINLDNELASGSMSTRDAFLKTFETNVVNTHLFTEAFVDLVLKSPSPRLVFISTGISSLEDHSNPKEPVNHSPPAGWPKPYVFNCTTYRISKTAMNMMIKEWTRVLKEDRVKVFAIDPGLLLTDLGNFDREMIKKVGAKDPIIGGQLIRTVVEGERDRDEGRLIKKDGVHPW